MIKSVLICTNHLAGWGGSELIVLELAEYLRRRGLGVTVFSNVIADPARAALLDCRVTFTQDADDIDLSTFDLVYAQHAVVSLLLHANLDRLAARPDRFPVFVYAHLSPFEPFEAPAPLTELQLADVVLANSPETAAALETFDAGYEIATIFPNPAPEDFFATRATAPQNDLRRLLIVSNHLPQEVVGAMTRLDRAGIAVTHVGDRGERRRISVSDMHAHDAVLSIGKTVQYALASRTPVFCYDQFGGPGWLNSGNFDAAARQNFSGRSQPDKQTAIEIADTLRAGFAEAQAFARAIPHDALEAWRLEKHLDRLLRGAELTLRDPARLAARHDLIASRKFRGDAALEGQFLQALRREYLSRLATDSRMQRLQDRRLSRILRRRLRAARAWFRGRGARQAQPAPVS